ncbi:MAG: hypothetical protein ACKOS8_15190, partial [Gemmataceae bacterium]
KCPAAWQLWIAKAHVLVVRSPVTEEINQYGPLGVLQAQVPCNLVAKLGATLNPFGLRIQRKIGKENEWCDPLFVQRGKLRGHLVLNFLGARLFRQPGGIGSQRQIQVLATQKHDHEEGP